MSKRRSIVLNDEYDKESTLSNKEEKNEIEIEIEIPKASIAGKAHHVDSPSKAHAASTEYSKHKNKYRYDKDGSLRSNFGDLNFKPRKSIFDDEIHYGSNFYGFYIAFWFCVSFFSLSVVVEYWINHGSLFNSVIAQLMIKDLFKIGLTDLAMYLSLYLPVLIQLKIKDGLISWRPFGRLFQIIFELAFIFGTIAFASFMKYPWIGQIYLMLHGMVLLMKVHSYGFFNGYLWDITNELKLSESIKDKISKKKKKKEEDEKDYDKELITRLNKSIEFCKFELDHQNFPNNLSLFNFFEYSMFPTLIYQTTYPRTEKIRKGYLIKKIAGIFGIILVLIAIAQNNLYPVVMECLHLQSTTDLSYRIKIYPLILIKTIPSFLSVYLLVFYLIWELILNSIAELSRFADRQFYSYWWNSLTWTEYARDWNVPVHKFLLRHVYHSSISAFQVNKQTAAFITFFLSSVIHELAMWVIFKKWRGYLLLLQMNQLSLVKISQLKWLRNRTDFNICIFWFGIVFGPSLMCTMYLVF